MKNLCVAIVLFFVSVCQASNDHTEQVHDGSLSIVRSEEMVGAFVVKNQRLNPERAEYEWLLYKKSENGELLEIDRGRGTTGDTKVWILPLITQNPIEFGPFKIYWSGNTNGRGFLYFSYYPRDIEISYCIQNSGDLSNIQQWIAYCDFETV